MARPNWKARHVRTLAELPEKLIKGRAYFVDDEGIILVDHGDHRGVQTYGNRPGIQGMPGEPLPNIESDIDSLAAASVKTSSNLYNEIKQRRLAVEQLNKLRIDTENKLQSQIDSLVKAAVENFRTLTHETLTRRQNLDNEKNLRQDSDSNLQNQINSLVRAILFLCKAVRTIHQKISGVRPEDTIISMLEDVYNESDSHDNSFGKLSDSAQNELESMLNDVYDDSDTEDNAISSMSQADKDAIKSLLDEIYG